ncbi:proximal sequence element A Pbp95 [Leptinotarsa decemlineata]|uniref:proximal sequence element A Pbp95 n=1 Tax=Leptinotarsa decemlineata TaxID=7539 RepID=UPI003D30CA86
MDDEADLNKMLEVLKHSKEENEDDDEFQYGGFINYDDSDLEECFEDENADLIEPYESQDCLNSLDLSSLYKYNPISSLKPEEKGIIDSCSDPDLKKILLLNRQKNMHLIQLYKKIKDLLIECKQNIVEKNEIFKQCKDATRGTHFTAGAWRLGAPYFKDRQLYCCPSNKDTLRKRANNELTIYDVMPSPKWTRSECELLVDAVKLNYNINQQSEVNRKIIKVTSSGGSKEELEELNARLQELSENGNSEIPPLNSDENIDWEKVSEVFIGEKHSDFECRSVWHVHLHPSFNNGPWTDAENVKLRKLVEKYKCQRWDEIAKELGTNRSSFIVCSHYFSRLYSKFKKGDFTFEEDRKLLEVINKCRIGSYIPWVKVVKHFKFRTRSQLHHRYTYYLSQNDKKSGKFSEAEDILIMICVDKFGTNYKKCTDYISNRSPSQIKARYNSNVKNFVKKGTWSTDEDRMILDHVAEHGSSSWTELAKKIPRSRGQLRQRYSVIKTFLEQHPEAGVEDVKRRKHNWSAEHQDFMVLRQIADQFKDSSFIPTIKDLEKHLKSMRRNGYTKPLDSPPNSDFSDEFEQEEEEDIKDVDVMLTNFFSNSFKPGVDNKFFPTAVKNAVEDIEVLLDTLNVRLDIPEKLPQSSRLDCFDLEILTALRLRRSGSRGGHVTGLVPPNLFSTIGLRSLLIKNLHFRNSPKEIFVKLDPFTRSSVSRSKFKMVQNLAEMTPEQQALVKVDRSLFYQRFYSLFKWPSLLTLEGPSPELRDITENIEELTVPPLKRTYSRANRSETNDVKRPRLVELMPPPEAPQKTTPAKAKPSLKLKPVTDKSVIANLLQDSSKKLFYFDKVRSGKGTKTVIKELKLNIIVPKNQSRQPKNNIKTLPQTTSTSTITSSNSNTTEDIPFATKSSQRQDSTSTSTITSSEFCDDTKEENPVVTESSQRQSFENGSNSLPTAPVFTDDKQFETERGDENSIDMLSECGSNMSFPSSTDDVADLAKLESVLSGYSQSKSEDGDFDDLYDLDKLNIFLKREQDENEGSDSDSEMSFTL